MPSYLLMVLLGELGHFYFCGVRNLVWGLWFAVDGELNLASGCFEAGNLNVVGFFSFGLDFYLAVES